MENLKTSKAREENALIDIIKMIATLLIVGSHALPLWSNGVCNYYYGQWLFRFCVPFFLISTGYYFFQMEEKRKKQFMLRLLKLYILSTILYLPLLVKSLTVVGTNWTRVRIIAIDLISGYGHLWYLIAAAVGCFICYWFQKKCNKVTILGAAVIVFAIGIYFDEYYKLNNIMVLERIGGFFSEYNISRSGLFFAFPMLTLGGVISYLDIRKIKNFLLYLLMIIFSIMSFGEATLFYHRIGNTVTMDLGIFNWGFAACLFILALKSSVKLDKRFSYTLRKSSTDVYIIHQYFLIIVLALGINGWSRVLLSFVFSMVTALLYRKVFALKNIRRNL